jgi:molybdate transport system regulatory protein
MPRRRPAPKRTAAKSPRAKSSARPTPPTPRATLRIDRGNLVALSEAGADLLEQIHATGSLSEAARRLRYSYRRAWMLLDAMNRRWDAPLVTTSIGGRRGGGAALTDLGDRVLRSFRDLQLHVEAALDHQTQNFLRTTRP